MAGPASSSITIDAPPIDALSFARAMEEFASFEHAPLVAVAVSGGPDSLALLLLMDEWARARGGSVLALTVDHGLRPDSAAEAGKVAAWAGCRGIEHGTLSWIGPKPVSAIQATARHARYRLLSDACAKRGILHLAIAHHADDQAETVLFRRDRGSGESGLAGMSLSRSLGAVRLIRPLLGWPKDTLIATCARFAQEFVEDPSNRASRFARTVLRQRLAEGAVDRKSLLARAGVAARARSASDQVLSGFLARIAEPRPDGIVLLELASWGAVKAELRRAALAAVLRSIGGATYPPSRKAIVEIEKAIWKPEFGGASLGGCLVRRWRGRILICREPGRTPPPVLLTPATWQEWDRFRVRIDGAVSDGASMTLGALGVRDYAGVKRATGATLPSAAGAALPAVRSDGRLTAAPAAGWTAPGAPQAKARYLPLWPLSPETFTVVSGGPDIMSA